MKHGCFNPFILFILLIPVVRLKSKLWAIRKQAIFIQIIQVSKVQDIAQKFIKSNLQNEGFELLRDNGPKLRVRAKSGKQYAIFIQGFDRSKAQSIKIHTREFDHKFRSDVWIALVLIFPDTEPKDYLIPTTVFQNPDEYIFFHHDLSSMNDHYSNVEIKVFSNGIRRLSEYAFDYQVDNLK